MRERRCRWGRECAWQGKDWCQEWRRRRWWTWEQRRWARGCAWRRGQEQQERWAGERWRRGGRRWMRERRWGEGGCGWWGGGWCRRRPREKGWGEKRSVQRWWGF